MQSDSQGMRDATVPASNATQSWDPYDVWLNRVKRPRDGRRVAAQPTPSQAAPAAALRLPADLSETARMRALTLPAG